LKPKKEGKNLRRKLLLKILRKNEFAEKEVSIAIITWCKFMLKKTLYD
jgi:hypothetical protein